MQRFIWCAALILLRCLTASADEPIRIICFGAHPDDCELKVAGTAAMWAAKGHKVKFVSVTNGDIGHWRESGPALARRRKDEVEAVAKMLGIETEVLDIHDGELEPTLANRKTITRLIREWKADIVMSHRPNDYHPDHRYTGVLVQDAAYMVAVPKLLPEIAPLKRNPVFLYYSDRFQKPNPFKADVAIAIDEVAAKKLAALERIVSQFYEGGATGGPQDVPEEPKAQAKRREDVRQALSNRDRNTAKLVRDKLADFYGKDHGPKVEFAEAFEVCEYGRQPDAAELRKLFPFFDK
ncbi:MAG TPA: PIG-L family deacetylase [Gemmataceae bacterium]|jgi:LmbE family N-acetylglucosaminyl deacetylase|nr:PIG-L family deacetylase [Gemmataceae bacterium]